MTQSTEPIHLKMEHTDSGCILHLRVPEDLYYLQGHFPGVPLVAGVCQLRWVVQAIEAYCQETVKITAMQAVKFHQFLFPGQRFVLEIRFDRQASTWTYRLSADDRQFASGRLVVAV